MFKLLHDMDPASLTGLFNYKNETVNYELRDIQNTLRQPQPRTNSMKKVSVTMDHRFGILYLRNLRSSSVKYF